MLGKAEIRLFDPELSLRKDTRRLFDLADTSNARFRSSYVVTNINPMQMSPIPTHFCKLIAS